jgi:peptide chain release factor subunit 1
MLKDKIIDIIDTAYIGEQGAKEVVDKAPEVMRKIRYVEEKKIVQQFLYEVGHDTGKITYGEGEVRRALEAGAVSTLLISDGLNVTKVATKCSVCGYQGRQTVKNQLLMDFESNLSGRTCPKCNAPALGVADTQDLIDELAGLAESTKTAVEIISTGTEEGQMLKNSFGGVAAMLRFKLHD